MGHGAGPRPRLSARLPDGDGDGAHARDPHRAGPGAVLDERARADVRVDGDPRQARPHQPACSPAGAWSTGRVALIYNMLGVQIGMVHVLLPFMVFPLLSVMTRIDGALVTAARSLGASPRQAFLRIFLPLSLPGVSAGVRARVPPRRRVLHHAGAARRRGPGDLHHADRAGRPRSPRLELRREPRRLPPRGRRDAVRALQHAARARPPDRARRA